MIGSKDPSVVDRYVDALLGHRRLIVLAIALATIGLGAVTARRMADQDNALHVWFIPGDPAYERYREVSREFESDRMVIVAFRVPDVFTPEILALVRKITAELEGMDGIARVTSITNVTHYANDGDDLVVGPFVPEIPTEIAALQALRREALSNPLYVGNLISPDGTTTAVIGRLGPDDDSAVKARIVQQVEQFLDGLGPDVEAFHMSGFPVMEYRYSQLAEDDQNRLVPLTFLFALGALYLTVRTMVPALVATLIQVVVFVGTVGTYLLLGNKMNMVMGILGPILIAACIGDSVYIIVFYKRMRAEGLASRDALVAAMRVVWKPCLFTSLTTAAGFIAFYVADLAPIRSLGVYAALGAILEYAVNFTLLPIVLYWMSRSRWMDVRTGVSDRRAWPLVTRLAMVGVRRPWLVIGSSLLTTAVAIAGIRLLTFESNTVKHFPETSRARRDLSFVEDNLSKVSSFEVVLRGRRSAALEPTTFATTQRIQRALARESGIGKTFSPADYLGEVKSVLSGGTHRRDALPESREEAGQLMLLAEGAGDRDIRRFISADASATRINVRAALMGSSELGRVIGRVQQTATALVPGDIAVETTGNPVLWVRINETIIINQLKSISVAFLIIVTALTFLLRSPWVALIAIIPNVIPIVVTFGFMGYVGIPLDPASAMFGSLAIGVAVDDTIQFANRYREELLTVRDRGQAMERTLAALGRPIVLTSLIMIAGFGVLCIATFKPLVYFGLLTGIALGVGLLGDLVLLPALFSVTHPWERVLARRPLAPGISSVVPGRMEVL